MSSMTRTTIPLQEEEEEEEEEVWKEPSGESTCPKQSLWRFRGTEQKRLDMFPK